MNGSKPRISAFKLALGLSAIATGVGMLLTNLDLARLEPLLRWWPLLMLALALAKFIDRGFLRASSGHHLLWGGIVGLLWMRDRMDLVCRWWPLMLVYWGALVLARTVVGNHPPERPGSDNLKHPFETKP